MAAVDLNLVKELRDRTNVGLSECKKALEKSNGDIATAIDLLKQWGQLKSKEKESKIATEGKVMTYVAVDSASIVEINCQTDFVANGEDFSSFTSNVAEAVARSGNADSLVDAKTELVSKTGENIVIRRFSLFKKGSSLSLLTTYDHPGNRLCALVETEASNREIFDSPEFREFSFDCAMQIAAMAPVTVSKDMLSEEDLSRQMKIFEAQLAEENKPLQSWPKIIEGKFGKWRKETVLLEQESIKEAKKSMEELRDALSKKLNGEIKILRFSRFALGEGQEKKKENIADEVSKLIS